jgi:uncharacterized repeat protein (TIGR01451 family)
MKRFSLGFLLIVIFVIFTSRDSGAQQVSATKVDSDTTPGTPLFPGDTIRWTIEITNLSGSILAMVACQDDIPANVNSFTVESIPAGATDNSTPGGGVNGTGFLDVGSITIPVDGTVSIVFTTVVDAGAAGGTEICNRGQVFVPPNPRPVLTSDPDAGGGQTCVTVLEPGQPLLSDSTKVLTDQNGGTPRPGDLIRYTINVINSGLGDATGVRVTDDVPADVNSFMVLTPLPAGAVDNSIPGGGANGTGYLDISGFTVPAGPPAVIEFTVVIDAGVPHATEICNQAFITCDQITIPAPTDDPVFPDEDDPTCLSVEVLPDLSTSTKEVTDLNGPPVNEGDILEYVVTIRNTGITDALNVHVQDDIPAHMNGFTVVSIPGGATDNSVGAPGGANGTGFLDVTGFDLAPGSSGDIVFRATVDNGVPNGLAICNQATGIAEDLTLPEATDDPATPGVDDDPTCVTVTSSIFPPDLSTSDKTATDQNGPPLVPGDTILYTITIRNTGQGDALGVSVNDSMPANVNTFTVLTIPAGATDASQPAPAGLFATGYLDVGGFDVPASGQETITFSVVVDPSVPDGTVICNSDAELSASNIAGLLDLPPACLTVGSGGCPTPPARIAGFRIVKNANQTDIDCSWLSDPNAGAYRIYSVIDPLEIENARGGNLNATLELETNATSDTVTGALTEPAPLIFYQVVGACAGDPSVEGPN